MDDVVAWCILGVVIAYTRASSPLTALWTVLSAILFIAFLAFVLRPILAAVTKHVRCVSKCGAWAHTRRL